MDMDTPECCAAQITAAAVAIFIACDVRGLAAQVPIVVVNLR
jgi:hypothetical protein